MKNIVIKELIASNWRSQNFHDIYGDGRNYISGRNASGKSTRMAAWFWLMSGYTDSLTPANTKLFDDRTKLTPDTATASVKAVVVIDGEKYIIERTAKAKFTKNRETGEYFKSQSDQYTYLVDEVERSATEFKEWLSIHVASEDNMRFILGGEFFINQIINDKNKARHIIERIVGEVSREEMTGDYSDIDELLKKYTLDEIEARAKSMSDGLNKRLNEIPALIRNAETEISEIEQLDFVANDKEIFELERQRDELDKQLLDLTERVKPQMEAKFKKEQERDMKVEVINKAYSDWSRSFSDKIFSLKEEINAIRKQNADSRRKHDDAVSERDRIIKERDNAIRQLQNEELRRERLLKERDEERARNIDISDTKCYNCGAELTGEKLQEAVGRFDAIKRERIAKIVAEGKATAEEIKRLEKIAIDAQKLIDAAIPEAIDQSTEELEKKVAQYASFIPTIEKFKETELAKHLQEDIDNVVIPEVTMPSDSNIKEQKASINSSLIPLYERRGLKARADKLRINIDELRTEQKEKGAEMTVYERQRRLAKQYKQEQMEVMSRKVNNGLMYSHIECWSKQKDGTVIPDLVLKDKQGVSYLTTNTANRIVTVIDVQRFFCARLGVNMPVFVDEMSVLNKDNVPEIEGVQMFYMFCSETNSVKIVSK